LQKFPVPVEKFLILACISLLDNRNRPIPQGIQRNNLDATRNSPFKSKNTNQEKSTNTRNPTEDYTEQLRYVKTLYSFIVIFLYSYSFIAKILKSIASEDRISQNAQATLFKKKKNSAEKIGPK